MKKCKYLCMFFAAIQNNLHRVKSLIYMINVSFENGIILVMGFLKNSLLHECEQYSHI